jgi:hypothetical protein
MVENLCSFVLGCVRVVWVGLSLGFGFGCGGCGMGTADKF